jgi:hypothetical protein
MGKVKAKILVSMLLVCLIGIHTHSVLHADEAYMLDAGRLGFPTRIVLECFT